MDWCCIAKSSYKIGKEKVETGVTTCIFMKKGLE